jgi:hypothetical protein
MFEFLVFCGLLGLLGDFIGARLRRLEDENDDTK